MNERDRFAGLWERGFLPPLHPDAWRVIPMFAVAALVLFWIWTPLGWIGVAATLWCATLFREPERVAPDHVAAALSPIDGIVAEVGSAPPPAEFGLGEGDRLCVSILLGPWDSHVARMPAQGRVARLARAHSDREGERLAVRIEGEGGEIGVALVASGPGRRILADAAEGQTAHAGDRLGLILFAGHAEIYLPAGSGPVVAVGQRMVAGETVLAEPAASRRPRRKAKDKEPPPAAAGEPQPGEGAPSA